MKIEFSQDQDYEMVEGRLRFSIDNVIRVERKGLFFNYRIYEQDVSGRTTNFSLPLEEASYAIYTHKKGMVSLGMRLSEAQFFDLKIFLKKAKPWMLSFWIHLFFLFFAFIFLKGSFFRDLLTQRKPTLELNEVLKESTISAAPATSIPDRAPYSGQSFWKVLDAKKPKPLREEKLAVMLQGELGKTLVQSSKRFQNEKSSLINFKTHSENNIGKLANLAGLKRKDVEKELSPSERLKAELELKNIMDQVQQQMRGLYGKVLQKDPSFNTRVIVLARVSHAGSLENLEVSSQGHNPKQNVFAVELSGSIRNNLAKISVPSVLAGYAVRREFIFWK